MLKVSTFFIIDIEQPIDAWTESLSQKRLTLRFLLYFLVS